MSPIRIAVCLLLACVSASSSLAQSVKTVPDSGGPPKIPAPARVVDSLQVASGEPRFALTAAEVLGVLAINSVASRIMFPNDMQDGVKVYSATLKSTWNHIQTERWVYD